MRKAALQAETLDGKAAVALTEEGVEMIDQAPEGRAAFREFAQESWRRWAEKSPMARKAVDGHIAFMKGSGLQLVVLAAVLPLPPPALVLVR